MLLEKNSVKLYETLIKIDQLDQQSVKYSDELKTHGGQFETIDTRLNREYQQQLRDTVNTSGFWFLIASLLVFLMPIGFIMFELGQITSIEVTSAGTKHLLTWVMIFMVYFDFSLWHKEKT